MEKYNNKRKEKVNLEEKEGLGLGWEGLYVHVG